MAFGIDHAWPYLGAALALVYIGHRGFATHSLDWLTCIQLPIYALHQFESHAIDVLGRSHAFLPFLHDILIARADLRLAPAMAESWATLVNVGAVWPWGLQTTYHGASEPLVGLGFAGLMAANVLTHAVLLLRGEGYVPGMATALLLCAPVSASMFQRCTNSGKPWEGKVSGTQAWGALAAGVVSHWVILETFVLMRSGFWETAGAALLFLAYGLGAPWLWKVVLERLPGIQTKAAPRGSAAAKRTTTTLPQETVGSSRK